IFRAKEEIVSVYSELDGLPTNNIYPIYEDRSGNVWIGTWSRGLCRFKDGLFTVYGKSDGMPGDIVSAIFEDRDGYLWVGYFSANVTRLKDGRLNPQENGKGS